VKAVRANAHESCGHCGTRSAKWKKAPIRTCVPWTAHGGDHKRGGVHHSGHVKGKKGGVWGGGLAWGTEKTTTCLPVGKKRGGEQEPRSKRNSAYQTEREEEERRPKSSRLYRGRRVPNSEKRTRTRRVPGPTTGVSSKKEKNSEGGEQKGRVNKKPHNGVGGKAMPARRKKKEERRLTYSKERP